MSLFRLKNYNDLAGHPVVGPSWEGFVIENLILSAPERTKSSFYRAAAGAEIDLLLELPKNKGLWAIEIKRGLATRPDKGFYSAIEDLTPDKSFIVYSGQERYPLGKNVEAISLSELSLILSAQS